MLDQEDGLASWVIYSWVTSLMSATSAAPKRCSAPRLGTGNAKSPFKSLLGSRCDRIRRNAISLSLSHLQWLPYLNHCYVRHPSNVFTHPKVVRGKDESQFFIQSQIHSPKKKQNHNTISVIFNFIFIFFNCCTYRLLETLKKSWLQ